MKNAESIRQSVSRSYARIVSSSPATGCCGAAAPPGAAATLAGYRKEDLDPLPPAAVSSSFGCGNPLAFAGVRPGQTVLDLGSGAGIDLLIAAERVGPAGRVIGVDMTQEMIRRAQQNVRAAYVTNVEIRQGLIEELPVEDASVDWVISNCVINLSPEKERVFSEIARVLRPGGQLSISDIVTSGLPDWMRWSAALYASCVAGAISEDEYLAGIRSAGLVDVAVTDRLVYDHSQLAGFVKSGEAEELGLAARFAAKLPRGLLGPVLGLVAGRIWSAKITGRKPNLTHAIA